MLVGKLADQRGDVGNVIAVVDLGLGRSLGLLLSLSLGLLGLGLFLGLFGLGFFLGCGLGVAVADADDDGADVDGVVFFSEDFDDGACDGGGDFGVDLVGGHFEEGFVDCDGVADLFQPAGDGAFGDGFAEFGHFNVGCLARCVCSIVLLGLFLSLSLGLLGLGFFFLGLFSCCFFAFFAKFSDDGADTNSFVLIGEDLKQNASSRGGDLGIDLVGGDLQQGFIGGDSVTNLFQPAGDGAFGDRFTELGHLDRERHCVRLLEGRVGD